MNVGDLVIKDMFYCKNMTTPDMMESTRNLKGIIIEVDGKNFVRVAWSNNYGVFWNCQESIEVVSEGR
jgi:hypothetical protein